jgi:NADP-dependent 3-hydroxy acid dehydrogenase YdfG
MSESTVAIVTGGASGIGAATAVELARHGARLVLGARPGEDASTTLLRVREAGGEAVAVEADVRDPDAVARLAAAALEAHGRIDLLVAAAGVADQGSVAAGDPGRWRLVVETNLLGLAYSVRAVLPAMLERGSGHVVLVASVSGRETYVGEPLYIASKWGVVGFGHALRAEVARAGIRVTLVEPGIVDTPLTRGAPAVRPLLDAGTPLQPEDVARAIVFAHLQPAHVAVGELVLRPLHEPDLAALGGHP